MQLQRTKWQKAKRIVSRFGRFVALLDSGLFTMPFIVIGLSIISPHWRLISKKINK